MQTVARPPFDVKKTFSTCISKIRNNNLRTRMEDVADNIIEAATQYAELADQKELHLFPKLANVRGVTGAEMIANYDLRMAGKKGAARSIYDAIKLLPKQGICPFCDHNVVSTLDHILPKALYPLLAVVPDNLVACCKDCNTAKLERRAINLQHNQRL